jgi:transcriptional regulator with XRE-family HTH domain
MPRSPAMPKRRSDKRDVEVGRRVRAFRLQKGLSQEKLADQLGVTFQQVQKYEKGTNRIAAGRLQRIAEILGIPIMEFFSPSKPAGTAPGEMSDLVDTTAALRLVRSYSRIRDTKVQQAVLYFVEQMAAE